MNRIALVANFNGPKSGGLKTVMNELCKQYSKLGLNCIQIIPGSKNEVVENEHFHTYRVRSYKIPFSGGYRIITNLNRVKKILQKFEPDVIEIHDRLTLIKIAKWARKKDITTVVFAHERLYLVAKTFFNNLPGLGILVKYLNKRIVKNVDHIVATTKFASREFEAFNDLNIHIVPLGVDFQTFSPKKRTRKFDPNLINLTLCSRLSKEKNPENVFKVVKHMNKSKTRVSLTVVGTGPLKRKLQKKYKDFSIKFLDYVNDKNQISNILANTDVLLAPGHNETFCLSALEAQACGTPVVGSIKSALKEIISNESGHVVTDDLAQWESSIIDITNNSKFREGAYLNALRFTWENSAKIMLGIYSGSLRSQII